MARKPADRQRSSLTPFYAILGVVALVGIAVIAFQMLGDEAGATRPIAVDIDPTELQRTPGIAIGREDAPVTIYEFADFQCPACGQYATFVTPLVKERLVDQGLVRWVHYDFPLEGHQHSFLAARAGRCANEQGKFWEFHDVVYGRQPSWSAASDPTDMFVEFAGQVGADAGQFESCLRSDKYQEEVSRSLALGQSLNVRGTPTLFVNGKQLATPPGYEQLEAIVREEAGVAAPAAAPAAGL